jgi:mannitol/fructose-specific phosphotransferase system IIA component
MITPDRIVSTTCPVLRRGLQLAPAHQGRLHLSRHLAARRGGQSGQPVRQGALWLRLHVSPRPRHDAADPQNAAAAGRAHAGLRPQRVARGEWDEALDYVADRLVEIYQRDGSHAMAAYCCAKATNEDNYLLQKLFRALFRTNNVDHCTRLCHAGSVVALLMSLGTTAMSNTAAEVIHNDCFIVTGSNTTENHPIIALQMKEAVRKRGAKLIVIDPRRLELCDFATLWLPLKPGANVPIFSAMAHVIVKEGLVNRDFIDAHHRLRRVRALARTLHAGTRRSNLRRRPRPDRRGGAPVRHGEKRRDLLGHGHLAVQQRHRQRAGADPPGAAHRAHRAAGHRAEPAARAEQRAGRIRRRRHALPLSRLHGGGQGGERAQVGAGVACRAGRAEPHAWADDDRDSRRTRTQAACGRSTSWARTR